MKFLLQITSSPFHSQGSITAYHFAKAVIEKGHRISHVFMFMDGVYHILQSKDFPTDELDICKRWRDLAKEHHIELSACINSVTKRGIENSSDFAITSYSAFVNAALEADRVLQFG